VKVGSEGKRGSFEVGREGRVVGRTGEGGRWKWRGCWDRRRRGRLGGGGGWGKVVGGEKERQ